MTSAYPSPCDGAGSLVRGGTHHPTWTLVATILASSLAFIDGSAVNVALPSIGRSLGASAADLQWTVNAYLLPLSALLLLGGAAGDHFGRRRVLIGGIVLFTMASVGCALAPSLAVLLSARALQGIGAAMLMPNSLAILGDAFCGEAKGRAIGTWAAVGAVAGAVGPPLGGWLVGSVGWQAIFYINLPVAICAMVIAWLYVGESQESGQPLDWAGAMLVTAALGALTLGLTSWSARYVMTPTAWYGLSIGAVMLLTFLVVERRRGDRAMMPLGLFGSREFVGLSVLTLLLYGALGGLLVLLPYVLITSGGYSPFQSGIALLPLPLILASASRLMGAFAQRGGPRYPLTFGPLVAGVGFALLVRVESDGSYWATVLPGIVVIALGLAGAVAPLTTAVLASVDDRHAGTASGFNSAIARTGGLIVTALCGAVIGQTGAALIPAFRVAAAVGAALAAASGLVVFVALRKR